MQIKKDFLRINTAPVDAVGGAHPEPEERPAERVLQIAPGEIDIKMSMGSPIDPKIISPTGLVDNTRIAFADTVGQFAGGFKRQCAECKFFNRHAWAALRQKWQFGSMDERMQLNDMRAAILETQNATLRERHTGIDGDVDPEHALADLGICHPLTEIENEPVIVHPMGACPSQDSKGNSLPILFEAANVAAEKRGNEQFDKIMFEAQKGNLK